MTSSDSMEREEGDIGSSLAVDPASVSPQPSLRIDSRQSDPGDLNDSKDCGGSFNAATSDVARKKSSRVYKLVLTGGPCAGKTTGQNRVSDFLENLGWKVYRVPETANILLGGGVKFAELSKTASMTFQENLIKTMLAIENTYFALADSCPQNCLVICDRGIMDATAFISADEWADLCKRNNWKTLNLRDKRYDQVIHLVSAANGAEDFYTTEDHGTRSEGVELARMLDDRASTAWVGHPYFDVIDNSTGFDHKLIRTIDRVCNRLSLYVGDRLTVESKKRKFLVAALPADATFPEFQDFNVIHDYLSTPGQEEQARLRARGQRGDFTYTHTIRRYVRDDQEKPELKKSITRRDYRILYAQKDPRRYSIYKTRRCFVWNHHYFQLDVYIEPCPSSCRGLILLETYTADSGSDFVNGLPPFLRILREVTGDPAFSMFNLSLMEAGAIRSESSLELRRRVKSENGTSGISVESDRNVVNAQSSVATRCRRFSARPNSVSSTASLNDDDDDDDDDNHTDAVNGSIRDGTEREFRNGNVRTDATPPFFLDNDGAGACIAETEPFHQSETHVGEVTSSLYSCTPYSCAKRFTSRSLQRSASLPPNADGSVQRDGEKNNLSGGS